MNWVPPQEPPFGDRITFLWKQGMRLVMRAAIAFALSTATAIAVGAAVTDSAFVQILVTVMAALAFWIPSFFIVVGIDRWLARRSTRRAGRRSPHQDAERAMATSGDDDVWRRLFASAPSEAQRLAVLKRSLENTRLALARAELDPEAHELCILIDRRLPDLIHHELEILPPDDTHRRQKLGELIDLVEQFARHCSRRDSADEADAEYQAKVLRRRFEARLSEF